MNTFRAVAVFPHIEPNDFEEFCKIAEQMMQVIRKQKSILRYDMFFSEKNTRCTILEEYTDAQAVFEHVEKNGKFLDQLTTLGGKIQGNVFPTGENNAALEEIRNNWDSVYHNHFLGKTN
jgi:quinol monooxygenase YgiN